MKLITAIRLFRIVISVRCYTSNLLRRFVVVVDNIPYVLTVKRSCAESRREKRLLFFPFTMNILRYKRVAYMHNTTFMCVVCTRDGIFFSSLRI